MAGSQLSRALGALEHMAGKVKGVPLQEIADRLSMPKSAAHRLMSDLADLGYVAQDIDSSKYLLTTKLMSLGFRQLGGSGIHEMVQPVLNRLAEITGELVRFAVVDHGHLPFIAKAQGAAVGLRYDPYTGGEADLSCSASGFVWLASLNEDEAIQALVRQGFPDPREVGEHAPQSISEVLKYVSLARQQGYSLISDMWAPGMSTVALGVSETSSHRLFGVLSVAGPSIRLTNEVMMQHVPLLQQAAQELSQLSTMSQYLLSINPPEQNNRLHRLRQL